MPNSGSPQRYLYNGEARAANLGQFLFLFLPSPSIHSKARVGGGRGAGEGVCEIVPFACGENKRVFSSVHARPRSVDSSETARL